MGNKKSNEEDLRIADDFLAKLEKNYPEVYKYLVKKANEKENGVYKYYLGVRNNRVILYYMGSKVGEIYLNKRGIHFDIDEYYTDKDKAIKTSFEKYKEALDDPGRIIKRVEEYAFGEREDKSESEQRRHYEKICQQWIINNINSAPDSKWFISDMEYTDGIDPHMRFGRFDLIAIGKEKTEGKYPVALIELKVGSNSFSGGISTSKNPDKQADIDNAYNELKKDLYKDPYSIEAVRYGSGLVSHIADYLRYLRFREELYDKRLKKEIITSIKTHQEIGVLDKKLFTDIKEDEIDNYPDIYFALYTELPEELAGNRSVKRASLCELKKYCYHYLYRSKGHDLLTHFGHQLDDGFTCCSNMKKLEGIIEHDDMNEVKIEHPIGDHRYNFRFLFIEPNTERDTWRFLENRYY